MYGQARDLVELGVVELEKSGGVGGQVAALGGGEAGAELRVGPGTDDVGGAHGRFLLSGGGQQHRDGGLQPGRSPVVSTSWTLAGGGVILVACRWSFGSSAR